MALPPARIPIIADNKTGPGIAGAKKSVQGLQNSMAKLAKGAALAGAALGFKRLISSQLEYLDNVGKFATQTGLATDKVGALDYAAKLSGISLTTIGTGLRMNAKNAGEAAQGLGMAQRAYKELGIEASELIKLPVDEQLEIVLKKLDGVSNAGERTRLAMTTLGRSGTELLKLDGNLGELTTKAGQLGITFNEQTVRGAEAANDAMTTMKAAVFASSVNLTSNMLPALESTAQFMAVAFPKAAGVVGKSFSRAFGVAQLATVGILQQLRKVLILVDEVDEAPEQVLSLLDRFRAIMTSLSGPGMAYAVGAAINANAEVKEIPESVQAVDRAIQSLLQGAAENLGGLSTTIEAAVIPALKEIPLALAGPGDDNSAAAAIDKVKGKIKEIPPELTIWERAARDGAQQMQYNMESFFFDPAEAGIKGFGKSMLNTLRQIAAKIATQKLLTAIFGKTSFAKFLPFADGGRPPVGRASVVGERGPELFVPDSAGTIIPNHKLGTAGGAFNQVNTFNIDAGADPAFMQQLPAILEENRRRTMAEISQQKQRGRF